MHIICAFYLSAPTTPSLCGKASQIKVTGIAFFEIPTHPLKYTVRQPMGGGYGINKKASIIAPTPTQYGVILKIQTTKIDYLTTIFWGEIEKYPRHTVLKTELWGEIE